MITVLMSGAIPSHVLADQSTVSNIVSFVNSLVAKGYLTQSQADYISTRLQKEITPTDLKHFNHVRLLTTTVKNQLAEGKIDFKQFKMAAPQTVDLNDINQQLEGAQKSVEAKKQAIDEIEKN